MQMLVQTGLLYFIEIMKLFILIVLALNMFLRKLKNLLDIKTKINIFRIKLNNSIICRYFYTGFIDFMFTGKTFTSLFSAILSYFKNE